LIGKLSFKTRLTQVNALVATQINAFWNCGLKIRLEILVIDEAMVTNINNCEHRQS